MGKSIRKKGLIGYLSNETFSFRGFQAYLAGAPNYNFPLYRQLVHEITQTFSKISQEILAIKNELNERCCLPTLSAILEKIQDNEKDKLELVRNCYFANDPQHGKVTMGSRIEQLMVHHRKSPCF